MNIFISLLLRCLILSGLTTLALCANGSDVFIQRAQLFASELNPNMEIHLTLKDPNKIPSDCPFPLFDVPNKRKTWGNISLKVDCMDKKYFIPVHIQALADVAVSSTDIQRGESLTHDNVMLSRQDITNMTLKPIWDPSHIYEAQAIKSIPQASIITFTMIKRAWTIKAGDAVTIKMNGQGFTALNMGKAINNAYQGDKVRIRLDNQSIIEGIATAPGQVTLSVN